LVRYISILLVLFVGLQSSLKLIILANFEYNRDRITELYCVNKNNPSMNCKGKCFLKSALKKEAAKEQKSGILNLESEVSFCSKITEYHFAQPTIFLFHDMKYIEKEYDTSRLSTFHPPPFFSI
jgi:hypothetical protein